MAILPGFASYERYLKTDSGYQLISERTLAKDVLLDDGSTVLDHLTNLNYNFITKFPSENALNVGESLSVDTTTSLDEKGNTVKSTQLQIGSSAVVCSDSEGGNLRLTSPSSVGGYWEIDGAGGERGNLLRFFHTASDRTVDIMQVLPRFSLSEDKKTLYIETK